MVGLHAKHFGADLVIAHMDDWALPKETLKDIPLACWMPVDTWPLSQMIYDSQKAVDVAWPLAISKFGAVMLSEAGFKPLYVPHGIDTSLFCPPEDRKALRQAMGVDDRFVILMVAANLDKVRKGYPEQLAAFSRFYSRHNDALLVIHTVRHTPQGLNLPQAAARMAIPQEAIRFSDQYLTTTGLVEPEMMRGTFGMADLYSGCSYAEGFGLPVLEALACGIPVVVTNGSAMPEVAGPAGWKVKSEQYWAAGHGAWWEKPLIADIVKAYEAAYTRGQSYQAKKKAAREHAVSYDVERVLAEYWSPAMTELEKRVGELR